MPFNNSTDQPPVTIAGGGGSVGTGLPAPLFPIRVVGLPSTPTAPPGTPPTTVPVTPPTTSTKPTAGVPKKLLSVAAVQTPVQQQSYVNCNVTVSFTRDPKDQYFDHVNVWFQGYHAKSSTSKGGLGLATGGATPTPGFGTTFGAGVGTSSLQLMATGNDSPVNFQCDATGETVTVYVQACGTTGLSEAVTSSAHCTVTLSGIVGPPPAPTIVQTLVGTPTGYQFSFSQVILPAGDEEVISNYNIFRNSTNSVSTAQLHSSITPSKNNTGTLTYIDDTTNHNSTFWYWVTAVNTQGYQSTATPAQTGQVSGSSGSIPPVLSTPFIISTTSTSVTIKTSPSCFFTRANGQKQVIGATTTAITGLFNGNTNSFFPYWDETSQALKFVLNTDCTIPNITGITMAAASSQYIETTTGGSIPAAFSVEMWVMGSAAGALFDYSAPQVIGSTTASVCQAQVTGAGEVEFSIFNGSSWTSVTTSGASVLDSTWHHIVCTYGSGTGTVYVDGTDTSDNSTFWTNASMGTVATTSGFWHFGAVAGKSGAPLTSTTYNSFSMSFVALYDATLSAVQALNHMQAFGNLGETVYLEELNFDSAVSLWQLNETSGTTAADSIGSNTGTYKGSPTLNQTSSVVTVQGTPLIAFPFNYLIALQQQGLQNRVPLSQGAITVTVGATTGVGGGGRGGIGGGLWGISATTAPTKRGGFFGAL